MLFSIKDFVKYSSIFIETGLAAGAGLDRALAAGFKHCKSVEAWEPFYQSGLKKYSHDKRVELFFGKSHELLPIMLDNVYSPSVIFLDAHPAGISTAGHDDLMEKGASSEFNQHTIITKEIKAILNHRNDHLIIIDDQDFNHTDHFEYEKLLRDANPNYNFYWFDEQLNENSIFYKNKILACVPDHYNEYSWL